MKCPNCGTDLPFATAQDIGRKGGSARSDRKTASSRRNAQLRWERVRETRVRAWIAGRAHSLRLEGYSEIEASKLAMLLWQEQQAIEQKEE